VHHHRLSLRGNSPPGFRVCQCDFVWILPLREGRNADIGFQPAFKVQQTARVKGRLVVLVHGFTGSLQAAQGRFFAGSIGVQRQDDAACEFLQKFKLVFSQRCAHRGNGVAETSLVQPDDIHVALNNDRMLCFANLLARQVQTVEQTTFIK